MWQQGQLQPFCALPPFILGYQRDHSKGVFGNVEARGSGEKQRLQYDGGGLRRFPVEAVLASFRDLPTRHTRPVERACSHHGAMTVVGDMYRAGQRDMIPNKRVSYSKMAIFLLPAQDTRPSSS